MSIDGSDLKKRFLGFWCFAPIFVPIFAGYPLAIFGCAFASAWVSYEAAMLLSPHDKRRGLAGAGLMFFGFFLPLLPLSGFILLLIGGAGFGLVCWLHSGQESLFIGFLMLCIVSLGYFAFIHDGAILLIAIACVITASDMGAYFSGRLLGGAKLAPSISPSKTWSGSIGGIILALIIAEGLYFGLYGLHLTYLLVLGVVLTVIVAQIGDLFESALKRRLGVKDSSQLVPGHGGALDRFDGYLTVLPFAALLHYNAIVIVIDHFRLSVSI